MPQDSSSSDRRSRCRECGFPRLRAVALLTDPVERAKLMAETLCFDLHYDSVTIENMTELHDYCYSHNPLLITKDLTCPICAGTVCIKADPDVTQTEACEDCRTLFTITHDGVAYRLKADEPPSANEVQSDLRYHERN